VDVGSKSVFVQSGLSSGLLTQEDMDEAMAVFATRGEPSPEPPSDEQLAAQLVALGRLTRWQAEALRQGQTKFTLGVYHLIDGIGKGGMAEVYKAEHGVMGRVVAVKVLPKSRSTPEAIASFRREVRAQAQLHHENLVVAHDAGQDGVFHFLVTEYVPGTDLRRLVRRRGKLSMATAAVIISQAARGLAHAHSRGFIHRDVKPGNLLVTPEGHTKVSDLGLVGYFNDEIPAGTQGGKIVGTADYLSPEQIISPNTLTTASDIYSLGCTLYYAVTGKVPFPGGRTADKARAHVNFNWLPIDPRRFNPDLTDEFVEVIADMMAKQVEDRIQTADEVVERLAPWASDPSAAQREITSTDPAPPAVIYTPPRRRPIIVEPLDDTEESLLVQPIKDSGVVESPSQLSQGTQPVAAAIEETVPIFPERVRYLPRHEDSGLTPGVRWLIAVGIATVVVVLATIILSALM
jgi:serine/threonine protein kinase